MLTVSIFHATALPYFFFAGLATAPIFHKPSDTCIAPLNIKLERDWPRIKKSSIKPLSLERRSNIAAKFLILLCFP